MKVAKEFEAGGKFLHAVQIYQSLINEYPEYAESYIGLAELYYYWGKKESAENIFEKIINIQPENLEVKIYFAEFLIKHKKWQKSIDVLSGFSSDDDPFISYLTGYSYYNLKEYELAKVFLLNFVITDEDPELIHNAYFIIAKIDLKLKLYSNALKFAKKAQELYNDSWELMLLFSKVYYYLEMFVHSADSITKALEIKRDEVAITHWAGKIYLKTEDFIKAKHYFAKCIDLKEDITSTDYTNLAHVCFKLGTLDEALNYYITAVRLDPKNKLALEGKEKTSNLLNNMVSDA
ncbi:tetratricopeptide repeat protein [bacterium BMS3Abin03]|nr:tetratricopeptide repeat protein [bacterium BMS3Abin03]